MSQFHGYLEMACAHKPLWRGAEGLQGSPPPPPTRVQGQRAGTEPGKAGPGWGRLVSPPPRAGPAHPGCWTDRPQRRLEPHLRCRRSRCPQTRTGAQPRPPCTRAAAIAMEAKAPSRAEKCRPGPGHWRPHLRTPWPQGLTHLPGSAPHLGAFSAVLRPAKRRWEPTASPPQRQPGPCLLPSPPRPTLRVEARPLPHTPGFRSFRPASRHRVASAPVCQGRFSGALGRPHSTLPMKSSPLGWGTTWPTPYVTAPRELSNPESLSRASRTSD